MTEVQHPMTQLLRAGRPVGVALAALLLIAGAAFAGNAMLSPRVPSSDGSQPGVSSGLELPDASHAPEAAESAEPSEPAETAEPVESAEPGEDSSNAAAEPGDDNGVAASDDAGGHDGSGDGPSASQSSDDGSGHD